MLYLKTKLLDESQLTARLASKVIGREVEGKLTVGLGVKDLGIQTVDNAAQVIAAIDERLVHTLAEAGGLDLLGIAGADGVYLVRIDAGALHKVDAAVVLNAEMVVPIAVHTEEVGNEIEAELTLEGDIVDGENSLDARLHLVIILGFQQEGDEGGVPVVAVKHFRYKIQMGDGLKHCPLEEGVLLSLRKSSPIDLVSEIIFAVDKIYGKTAESQLFKPRILASPAQIDVKFGDMLHALRKFFLHAAVVRGNDAGVKAKGVKALGESARHIGKTACF